MYGFYVAALAATASLGEAASIQRAPVEVSKRGIDGLPDDGLITNCFAFGFVPSDASGNSPEYTIGQINDRLGAKSSTTGIYAQIEDGNFPGNQLLDRLDDVKASGAVLVASVMPKINFKDVTPDVASKVRAVMDKITNEGVTVWLRFAHEMNYYVTDGTYSGDSAGFLTAWNNIYEANCKDNDKVKCFWSPNEESDLGKLAEWWPGKEVVDIVGIDCYARDRDPNDPSLFDTCFSAFYDTYAKANNLPFAIGETAAGPGKKGAWLKQLVGQDRSKYPLYASVSWFEFDKEEDFRIVMLDDQTLQEAKDILLAGAGTCD